MKINNFSKNFEIKNRFDIGLQFVGRERSRNNF